jgi:hypothetical protein
METKMAVKVETASWPGWNNHPVYHCKEIDHYREVISWAHQNNCDPFLLSSGSSGYVFQVRANHEWFVLKWQ